MRKTGLILSAVMMMALLNPATIWAKSTVGGKLKKGKLVAGGDFTILYTSQKMERSSGGITEKIGDYTKKKLSVEPYFGYFVTNKLLIGGSIILGTEKEDNPDGTELQTAVSKYGIKAGVDYFLNPRKKLTPVFGGSLALLGGNFQSKFTGESKKFEHSISLFQAQGSAGIAYFLGSNRGALLLLKLNLNYSSTTFSPKGSNEEISQSGIGMNISFGIKGFF